ncbi:MAG: hypothetical protein JW891_04055 [Candidatus Lokiarchaeota archaeon]|nr:hypothetical protein [Candidatus Lokiarchaeota archaeon]
MVEKINITYLYGYGSDALNHLNTIIPLINEQIASGSKIGMVLIHDSVVLSFSKRKFNDIIKNLFDLPVKFFAMSPDLKARGISADNLFDKVEPIEYTDLVDVLENSEKIVSWM